MEYLQSPLASTPSSMPGRSISAAENAPVFHDVDQQRLRILRCTARAMASTPGGLRFSPGARPWLDGLMHSCPGGHAGGGGQGGAVSPATDD